MAYLFAGQFGPTCLTVVGTNNALATIPNTPINVYLTGGTTPATLWTTKAKTLGAANPVNTDANGNLAFFVDPGIYDLNYTYAGKSTTVTIAVDYDPFESHLSTSNQSLTTTAGAAMGTSPPARILASNSNDLRGQVTFGSGTATATGILLTVSYSLSWASAPAVVISPITSATEALGLFVVATTASSFAVSCIRNAPAISQTNTTYGFSWIALGG